MSIKITDLLEAGVHFGHQTRRWNPKMKPYIYGSRNGIHIFDLSKTMVALNNACKFLYSTVADGGDVLFIGTKRQSQEIVEEAAKASNMHYISYRWLGGTLTNLTTIRKSVAKLKKYTKMEEDGTLDAMKKKEASQIRREKTKLENSLSGIIELQRPPAVVVIVDINKEHIAIKEAHSLGIPVVAILDSNTTRHDTTRPDQTR
jgi:small subunit ribosomal protein S2